jgi:hypothetical protein
MSPKWFWLVFFCLISLILINRVLIIKAKNNKRLLKLQAIFRRINTCFGWVFLVAFLISIFAGIQMFGSMGL